MEKQNITRILSSTTLTPTQASLKNNEVFVYASFSDKRKKTQSLKFTTCLEHRSKETVFKK